MVEYSALHSIVDVGQGVALIETTLLLLRSSRAFNTFHSHTCTQDTEECKQHEMVTWLRIILSTCMLDPMPPDVLLYYVALS